MRSAYILSNDEQVTGGVAPADRTHPLRTWCRSSLADVTEIVYRHLRQSIILGDFELSGLQIFRGDILKAIQNDYVGVGPVGSLVLNRVKTTKVDLLRFLDIFRTLRSVSDSCHIAVFDTCIERSLAYKTSTMKEHDLKRFLFGCPSIAVGKKRVLGLKSSRMQDVVAKLVQASDYPFFGICRVPQISPVLPKMPQPLIHCSSPGKYTGIQTCISL